MDHNYYILGLTTQSYWLYTVPHENNVLHVSILGGRSHNFIKLLRFIRHSFRTLTVRCPLVYGLASHIVKQTPLAMDRYTHIEDYFR